MFLGKALSIWYTRLRGCKLRSHVEGVTRPQRRFFSIVSGRDTDGPKGNVRVNINTIIIVSFVSITGLYFGIKGLLDDEVVSRIRSSGVKTEGTLRHGSFCLSGKRNSTQVNFPGASTRPGAAFLDGRLCHRGRTLFVGDVAHQSSGGRTARYALGRNSSGTIHSPQSWMPMSQERSVSCLSQSLILQSKYTKLSSQSVFSHESNHVMTQSHFSHADDITCENITNEVIASYAAKGFTLFFAEKVMHYDLSVVLPHLTSPPLVSYLTWDSQSIHAFFTVYQAAFQERPGFPGWSEEEWVRWISSDPTFRPDLSFLAIAQGQPVGFVTNAEDEAVPEQNGYLIQMGVHPQWRGQKLATALVVRSLHAWQQEGKKSVILHVNVNNPAAIQLYQQLGFTLVRQRGKFRPSIDRNPEI